MAYVMKNCPLCGQYGRTDQHHLYPQCYFKGDGPTVNICHNCHQGGIEQIMPTMCVKKEVYDLIFIKYAEIQCAIYKTDLKAVLRRTFGCKSKYLKEV